MVSADTADSGVPPSVSVVMPVRNASIYLKHSIESILEQSFTDFEFLIVDDGSTDGSAEDLRRYADADPRIRLTVRANAGLVSTLNEMLRAARGEFIARMDADDVALPNRFKDQLDFLRTHPDIVCVGGAYVRIDERGRRIMTVHFKEDHEAIQESALSGVGPLCHPSVMMRRKAVMQVGGYDHRWVYAEDLDLWLRLGEVGRLANLPQVVLFYRVHKNGRTWEDLDCQAVCIKEIVEGAYKRRGLSGEVTITPIRWYNQDRVSQHEYASMCSYWALREGERSTSLAYAAHAISLVPWRVDGWKRLARALVGV